jgi:diadenosine tetraphosphatase ApaH/serine/threonine PP2A family protein phosphatase
MDSFDYFPLACVINGKFIAFHGGISPELKTVIYTINLYYIYTINLYYIILYYIILYCNFILLFS